MYYALSDISHMTVSATTASTIAGLLADQTCRRSTLESVLTPKEVNVFSMASSQRESTPTDNALSFCSWNSTLIMTLR